MLSNQENNNTIKHVNNNVNTTRLIKWQRSDSLKINKYTHTNSGKRREKDQILFHGFEINK